MVGFNLLAGGLSLLGSVNRGSVIAVSLVLVVISGAALWWRRRHSSRVLLVVLVAAIAAFAVNPERDPSSPALAFAVYAVSVYDQSRLRLWVAVASIAVVAGAVALLSVGDLEAARKLVPAGATSLVAWVIGDYVRSRRQTFRELLERGQQARRQAVEEERLRIARELHDVVAHNVSVIAIQAGAARVSGSSSAEALRSIEDSARATLAELNRLVGILRRGPGGPELGPQPTLDGVESVLKPARDAGLDVTLKVSGERRELPAAVDLSAFRIVQESITNVLKHASATRVEIHLDYRPDALDIAVSDNGRGAPAMAGSSTGHGLIGMRERVEVFDGELTTGTSPLGGFNVHARLPLK
ncbi:MAG TPA: histidine kinase [Candidatus Dormibacteraeota bacterium]|nr:histidine kinase [Candidatus Dormibacteraeota bacterium]